MQGITWAGFFFFFSSFKIQILVHLQILEIGLFLDWQKGLGHVHHILSLISHASILNDNETHTSRNPSTHLVDWTRIRTQIMFQISDRERVYLEDFARFYKNESVMKKKKSHFRLGKFLYIRSSEFRLDRLLSIIGKP